MTKAAALREVALDAYREAEAGLGFALFRMMGYAARRLVEERFGIPADSISIVDDFDYVLNTIRKNDPETWAMMNIFREARGVGFEPHTDREVKFGTLGVRTYISSWRKPDLDPPAGIYLPHAVQTVGPEGRYGGLLLVEKEGLLPLLQSAEIGVRFDLMVAATRGQGVGAVKELIEEFSEAHPDLPVYVLHDFDIAGVSIRACLAGKDSKRWEWSIQPNVVDLGLTLAHVRDYDVLDETVSGKSDPIPNLMENGATAEDIEYFVSRRRENGHWEGRRAELNGLVGQKLIDFVETRLVEEGCTKLIPDDEDLEDAYRRAVAITRINTGIKELMETLDLDGVVVPGDLYQRVETVLDLNPSLSWDAAVAQVAGEGSA